MVAPVGLGIAEVSYTSGTGPYTLGGAPAGAIRFRDVFADGQRVTIIVRDGNQYEESRSIYTAPDVVTVVKVAKSSDGGNKISWPASGFRVVEYVPEILAPVQVTLDWPGRPPAGQVAEAPICEDLRFQGGFPRSLAKCRAAPTADAVITVSKIDLADVTTEIGRVTFLAGATRGSWMSYGGAAQFVPHGSFMQFVFPSPLDRTFADISLAAWGNRTNV